MAKGLGSFSLELNVDVSKSKEQVEQFVKTYQTQMKRLESGVSFENFQKFADSLKEVDALLSNLKKNNSNLFQAIFGGLDRGLLQQLQNIFNTDAPVLKQLNNIQLKIDTAKTVTDVQKVAVEINKIFKSIGRPEIFDPRAMYTKKDMAVYKSQLTNALGDVGKDIIKATSLSGFDINDIIPKSYEQALDNTIIKLNNKIKTVQETKNKLNTAFNAAQSTTNTDYTKGGVDNYVELSEVQNAEVAYKNADAVLKSFTADEKQSLEYMKAEIEYFNKLAEYNRKLSKFTSSEANAKIFEKLPDDFQEQLRKENVRISNLISESSSKFLDKGKSNAYGKLLDQTKLELSTIESEKAEYQQVYDIVKKIADEKSRSVQENRKAKYNSIFYDYGSKYNQLDAEKLASHIDINNPESLDRAAKTLMSVFGNTTSDNITNSLTKAMQEIASAETVVENKATETAATVTKANEQIVQSEQAVAQAAEKVKEEIATAKQTTTDNKVVEQVNAETDALKSEASEYEILVEILKKYRDIFDNLYNKHGDISSKGFQKDIAAVNKTFDASLKKAFPEINDTALRTLKERVAMKYDKNDPQQYSLARIINESFGEIDSLKEKMVAGKKVIEDYRALLAEAEDVVGKSKTLAESKDTVTSNKSTKKTVEKWQQQYEDLRTQYRAVIGERKEFETAEVKKDSPQYLANLTEGQKILNESLEIVNKIRGNKNITDEIKAKYDAEAKSIIAKINKSLESNSLIQQRIANAKDPNNKNASWLNSEDSARKMYDAQNAKIVGREQAAMKKIEQLKANSDNNIKNAYNALADENKNLQSNLNQANSNLTKEKENHAKTTAALAAANSELESLKKLVTETTGTTVAESKETTQAVKAKKKSKTKAKAETVTTTEEKQTTKSTTDTTGTGVVGTGGTAIDAKATVSITNAIRTASNTIKTAIDSSTQQIVAAVKNDDDNTNTKPVVENTEPDANNTAVIESISANVTNLSTVLQSAINNAAQTVANAVSKNSNELASVSSSLKNMKFISDKEIKNLGYTKTQSGEVSKLKLDASKRITNEYDKLSAEAGKTVSHIGNEVQIANMRALQSGIIKVTGAVKDANGVWQGFTTNIDKSNKATLEGINANSGYAKKLQSLDKAAMELEQKRTKLTSEIKGYADSFDGRTKDGKNIKGQLKPILDEIANADTKKLAELAKSFDAVKKGYTELQETRKKEAQAKTDAYFKQQREQNAKAEAEQKAQTDKAQKLAQQELELEAKKEQKRRELAEREKAENEKRLAEQRKNSEERIKVEQEFNEKLEQKRQEQQDIIQEHLRAKAEAEEAARKAEDKKNEKISQSAISKNLAKYQTEAGALAQTLNADVYNTKKVKDLEDRYKTAYNKVAALGASLPKDSPLNAQQAEQWRNAVAEMDKYKKELNSIIVETEKLRNIPSGKRRTMSEQELAELTASGEYRKKLVEFAQATRPVGSTGAAEIKAYNEELRQLEYTIQNSDNTLTTYKAKLSATGNELIAVAIKTEQMKQQTSEADKEAQKLSRDFNKAQKEMQKEFAAQSEKISNSPFYNNKIGQRLSGLRGQMASATTVEELEKVRAGINAINNDLGKAQDSVKNKVNGIKNSVNAAFKTVDFKKDTANLNTEQQAIVDKYTRLIDLTNQFKADGSNASMAVARSIQQLGKELTNDIKLYNEANGIINANGGRTKAAPYALNVSKADVRAAGIQNAISDTDSLATSNIVNVKLEEYINALQRLKDIQSQFKIGEVLSPEQKTQFGAAEKQVNALAKELEKLISSVTTLREESARTAGANASLGIDDSTVVRTNELRAAMEQLARQTYGNATVSIGEFNDRLRELSFTVNDNKGSISDMRAVLSQAGNEIYLVADSTRQTTGTLANFANMVKTKFASIGSYLMASFGYYRVFSEIRKGIGYVKEIDAALTEVRKVTNETDATYKEFVQDMAKVGSVVGATTSSLVNSAADWARFRN